MQCKLLLDVHGRTLVKRIELPFCPPPEFQIYWQPLHEEEDGLWVDVEKVFDWDVTNQELNIFVTHNYGGTKEEILGYFFDFGWELDEYKKGGN